MSKQLKQDKYFEYCKKNGYRKILSSKTTNLSSSKIYLRHPDSGQYIVLGQRGHVWCGMSLRKLIYVRPDQINACFNHFQHA